MAIDSEYTQIIYMKLEKFGIE